MNIWIWAPSLIEFATPLNILTVYLCPHKDLVSLNLQEFYIYPSYIQKVCFSESICFCLHKEIKQDGQWPDSPAGLDNVNMSLISTVKRTRQCKPLLPGHSRALPGGLAAFCPLTVELGHEPTIIGYAVVVAQLPCLFEKLNSLLCPSMLWPYRGRDLYWIVRKP